MKVPCEQCPILARCKYEPIITCKILYKFLKKHDFSFKPECLPELICVEVLSEKSGLSHVQNINVTGYRYKGIGEYTLENKRYGLDYK